MLLCMLDKNYCEREVARCTWSLTLNCHQDYLCPRSYKIEPRAMRRWRVPEALGQPSSRQAMHHQYTSLAARMGVCLDIDCTVNALLDWTPLQCMWVIIDKKRESLSCFHVGLGILATCTIDLPVFLERFGEFPDRFLGQLHPFQLHLRQSALVLSNALAQVIQFWRVLPHSDW